MKVPLALALALGIVPTATLHANTQEGEDTSFGVKAEQPATLYKGKVLDSEGVLILIRV